MGPEIKRTNKVDIENVNPEAKAAPTTTPALRPADDGARCKLCKTLIWGNVPGYLMGDEADGEWTICWDCLKEN